MRKLTLGIVLLLVATACGGGGDDGADPTVAGDGNGSQTTTTLAASTTTTTSGADPASGPGSDTEWCQRDSEINDQLASLFTLSPQGLEDAMRELLQVAAQAADDAPSEIEDEVMVLLRGVEDLDGALTEINYDVFNNLDAFEADIRVMFLESDAYLDAANAVSAYCGDDVSTAGDLDPTVTLPPGAVVGDLPEDFPSGLIPPGVTSTQTIQAGPGYQATFTTNASFDDVVAAYTDELGAPQSNVEAGGIKSAQWFQSDGSIILVQEVEGMVSAVVAGAN